MKTIQLCCRMHPNKNCLFCSTQVCEDHEFCTDKCTAGYNARVRTRKSYRDWKRLIKLLKGAPLVDVLKEVHNQIDRRSGFKSQYNSDCSKESLLLACQDLGEQK